jgi:cellulose synthase (UDP-forming)
MSRVVPPTESQAIRLMVRGMALAAIATSVAYLVWRTRFTLGHDLWLSVPLLIVEIHALVGLSLFTFSLWDLDALSPPPIAATSAHRLAVLIPTYNEPEEILLPTIAAAVAVDLEHETWVLDDGNRPWVAELAAALGARYLRRPTHDHAKAGNLNHALGVIEADVVAILDADHVASPGLLSHTVGYFDDPRVALVQTPQDFYNTDSFEHAHNRSILRGHADRRFNEQSLFYRAIQPGKNRWNAAFWCGTSALVRVAALRAVGGVATESLTEDIHTTIRLHKRGWKTCFHNEVLAKGLAAADAAQYLSQRVRWGSGAMQVIRMERPFTHRDLTPSQRLAYLATLLGWFDSWRTVAYLVLPMAMLMSGGLPIVAPWQEFAIVFASSFIAQRFALSALSRGYAPQGMAILFELIRMPANFAATMTLFSPGERRFNVTAKGRTGDDRSNLAAPRVLWLLLACSIVTGAWAIATLAGWTPMTYSVPWAAGGSMVWLVMNAVMLAVAISRIRSMRFATDRRSSVRVATERHGRWDGTPVSIIDLSVGGALVEVPHGLAVAAGTELMVDLGDATVTIRVTERSRRPSPDGRNAERVGVEFLPDQTVGRARLAVGMLSGSTPSMLTAGAATNTEPVHDTAGGDGLTVPEAALLLGVSKSSLYARVRSGHIPSTRRGRRILIPLSAVADLSDLDDPGRLAETQNGSPISSQTRNTVTTK